MFGVQRHLLALLVALALGSTGAMAGTAQCLVAAGKQTGIDPLLIWAVKLQESGRSMDTRIVGRNKNGSMDLGLMQINDRTWLPHLGKAGITRQRLLEDGCLNLHVGAAVLAYEIGRHGVVEGIGRYHSPTATRAEAYRRQVITRWRQLREEAGYDRR